MNDEIKITTIFDSITINTNTNTNTKDIEKKQKQVDDIIPSIINDVIKITTNFDCKNHSLTINTNTKNIETIIKKQKKVDDINPSFINDAVNKFNKLSDDLIVDYNYEIIDKEHVHFFILFKQILSKLGETQKYIKCMVTILDNKVSIVKNDKIKLSLKIPKTAELIFIDNIEITNNINDGNNNTITNFTTDKDTNEYKNFDLLYIFIKKLIIKIYNNYNK